MCDANLSCSIMFCMKKNKCKKEWNVATKLLNISLVTGTSNKRDTSNSKEDSNREDTRKILQVLRAFGIPQRKHLYFISVSGAFLGTSLPVVICLCSAYAYAVFMLMPCLCLCSVFPAWCVLVTRKIRVAKN